MNECNGRTWIRTIDHLAANGREPQEGERQWNLDFEADTGERIRIHVGPQSRELMLAMLRDECGKEYRK